MNLTEKELQYRIIYSIIVAGKNARFAENATKKLFNNDIMPFEQIKIWIENSSLEEELKKAKIGNYNKMYICFKELIKSNINLFTCSPADLEKIHGIGPKTARFFILWTRPDANVAALDVHILRWLGKQGYNVPKSTPNGKKYAELEKAFLNEAEKLNLAPAELDKNIWTESSGFGKWNPDDFISKEN